MRAQTRVRAHIRGGKLICTRLPSAYTAYRLPRTWYTRGTCAKHLSERLRAFAHDRCTNILGEKPRFTSNPVTEVSLCSVVHIDNIYIKTTTTDNIERMVHENQSPFYSNPCRVRKNIEFV